MVQPVISLSAVEFLIASLSADIRHHPAPYGSRRADAVAISAICVGLSFDGELSETPRCADLVHFMLLFLCGHERSDRHDFECRMVGSECCQDGFGIENFAGRMRACKTEFAFKQTLDRFAC
jgi:hypothetical protein